MSAAEDFFNGHTVVLSSSGQEVMTKPLKSVIHPEHKRNIIGDTFIKVCSCVYYMYAVYVGIMCVYVIMYCTYMYSYVCTVCMYVGW